jgi:hypothetical protein
MEQHRRALGIAHIVYSLLLIIASGVVYLVLTTVGYLVDDPEAERVLPLVATIVSIVLGVISIPGLIAGFGLIANKSWGLILALVVGILNIFSFPFGTALGAYTIWVFIQENDRKKIQSP